MIDLSLISFSGIKSNYETSGVDSSVLLDDCQASLNKSNHVDSILKWAQDANKATGFVTTTRYNASKFNHFNDQMEGKISKYSDCLFQCGSCNAISAVCTCTKSKMGM